MSASGLTSDTDVAVTKRLDRRWSVPRSLQLPPFPRLPLFPWLPSLPPLAVFRPGAPAESGLATRNQVQVTA